VTSTYTHTVAACQVGGTDCTKTTGYIKVNGSNVFSWGTAAVTQSGNIQINPGDIVVLEMNAIDPPSICVNNGIDYSDVSAQITGPGVSFGPTTESSPSSGDSGQITYTFTATGCGYTFDLDSTCS